MAVWVLNQDLGAYNTLPNTVTYTNACKYEMGQTQSRVPEIEELMSSQGGTSLDDSCFITIIRKVHYRNE